MKKRYKILLLTLVGTAAYALLAFILALPLLGNHGLDEPLRIDTITGTPAQIGHPIRLNVNGNGFDQETSFFLALDSGNQQAITHRLNIFSPAESLILQGESLTIGTRNQQLYQIDISDPEASSLRRRNFPTPGKPMTLALLDNTLWIGTSTGQIFSTQGKGTNDSSVVGKFITDLAPGPQGTLLAAANRQGLLILQPQIKSSPTLIGAIELPGAALALAAKDFIAYVAGTSSELHVCDISDPKSPKLLTTIPCGSLVRDIEIRGPWLYVASKNQLLIFDTSDAPNPIKIAELPVDNLYDIALEGDRALLATGKTGLLVLDISNPHRPRITGYLQPGNAIRSVVARGKQAFVGIEDAVLVVDLEHLQQLPQWHTGNNNDALTHNFTPDTAPTECRGTAPLLDLALRGLPEGCYSLPEQTACNATTMVMATECGLALVDRQSGELHLATDGLISISKVDLQGATAFATGSKGPRKDKNAMSEGKQESHMLQLYDVRKPKQPRTLGSLDAGETITHIVLVEKRAYLSILNKGVMVVDISDPDHPEKLGTAQLPWPEQKLATYHDIHVVDNYLYLAAGRSGLQTFDVSDPRTPKRISAFNTPNGWIKTLAGNETTLFASANQTGLHFFSLEHPGFPRLVGSLGRYASGNLKLQGQSLQLQHGSTEVTSLALPLQAKKIGLSGSTQAELEFAPPTYPGDYILYAFNGHVQQQAARLIHVSAAQK